MLHILIGIQQQVKHGKFSVPTGSLIGPSEIAILTCDEGYRVTRRKFTCADDTSPRCVRRVNNSLCRCLNRLGRCIKGKQTVVCTIYRLS